MPSNTEADQMMGLLFIIAVYISLSANHEACSIGLIIPFNLGQSTAKYSEKGLDRERA